MISTENSSNETKKESSENNIDKTAKRKRERKAYVKNAMKKGK